MKLGVANKETWIFLEDIVKYLSEKYPTDIFQATGWPLPVAQRKMTHWMLRRSLKQFIHRHDVVLFEWASELLVEASDVYTPDAAAFVVRLHRYEMFQWVQRIKWETVRYVLLDTEAMRQKLLARTNLAPERAIVLPNAVPLAKTSAAQRPFQGRIAILANLIPRKRVYELILAFYAALQQRPDLTLHVGGPPRPDNLAYYESLHDLCRKLGIEEQVTFYGRVEDRWDWYQQMDVFVSFGYSEGMQVAPIEAAASGCYCLSHWWEGAEEIFPRAQLSLTEAEFVAQVLAYSDADAARQAAMRQPLLDFVEQSCNLGRINHEIEQILVRAHQERQAVRAGAQPRPGEEAAA